MPLVGNDRPDQKLKDSHHLHVQRPQPPEDQIVGQLLLRPAFPEAAGGADQGSLLSSHCNVSINVKLNA